MFNCYQAHSAFSSKYTHKQNTFNLSFQVMYWAMWAEEVHMWNEKEKENSSWSVSGRCRHYFNVFYKMMCTFLINICALVTCTFFSCISPAQLLSCAHVVAMCAHVHIFPIDGHSQAQCLRSQLEHNEVACVQTYAHIQIYAKKVYKYEYSYGFIYMHFLISFLVLVLNQLWILRGHFLCCRSLMKLQGTPYCNGVGRKEKKTDLEV